VTRRDIEVFTIGAVVGAVIGVVLGILIAPQSGSQTRKRLAEEAARAADVARGFAERAETAAESLGQRVDHYLGRDEQIAWRKVQELREGVARFTRVEGT
jgi:gas vesicle protein